MNRLTVHPRAKSSNLTLIVFNRETAPMGPRRLDKRDACYGKATCKPPVPRSNRNRGVCLVRTYCSLDMFH
jgi:hypothetical protein